ncbi:MAG: methyltransferase domain-containing protein [Hyphomicrobiales bacterium]|nr:MAG: methyltransferase domain-containing protein [Hyphomicrobiales bacterium]
MRRCLQCRSVFEGGAAACPACGDGPPTVDGFVAYAPELARSGGGFKERFYDDLARLEDANFWFRARNALVCWALERYAPQFQSMLEVGCGTAYVLSGIARSFPGRRLVGSEIFVAGLGFAAGRLPAADFVQMDARAIPFEAEFDVVGAFDVVEHIKEDELVLAQMRSALKPGGVLLLTVPQHACLWSASDVYACHERRYEATDLHRKLREAGFELTRSTSFVTALLPALALSRVRHRKADADSFDPLAEFNISRWVNRLLEQVLAAERAMIRRGLDLPVGGSRLIVARKV